MSGTRSGTVPGAYVSSLLNFIKWICARIAVPDNQAEMCRAKLWHAGQLDSVKFTTATPHSVNTVVYHTDS